MATTLLLVHSPLVGPSSWKPLDEVARQRGIGVIRPDLTGVVDADSPQWKHLADVSVRSAVGHSDLVVVGHSGAGAILPTIAERIGERVRAVVFVDALVPPSNGEHRASQGFIDVIDHHAVEGTLPKWLDWWPSETVDELVTSRADQDALRADMPRLRQSFYDDPVPVPAGWSTGPCAYLQLSPAYDAEFSQAADLGWATATIDGTHLSIFTDPSRVLDALDHLLSKLDTAAHFDTDAS